MLFVRLFAGVIVWLCVILYFAAVIVLAVFLFLRAEEYKSYILNFKILEKLIKTGKKNQLQKITN